MLISKLYFQILLIVKPNHVNCGVGEGVCVWLGEIEGA